MFLPPVIFYAFLCIERDLSFLFLAKSANIGYTEHRKK